MIADNLKTRGIVKPLGCQFCAEEETISHLFFDCVVAKEVWRYAAIHCNLHVQSYFDMARKWICDFFLKKHGVLSIISAGVCWMIWLTRNDMVFRHQYWVDIKMIIRRMNRCIASWKLTATQEDGVNRWCNTWRRLSGRSWQSGPPKENQTEHRVGVLNLGLAFLEVLCSCFFFLSETLF